MFKRFTRSAWTSHKNNVATEMSKFWIFAEALGVRTSNTWPKGRDLRPGSGDKCSRRIDEWRHTASHNTWLNP